VRPGSRLQILIPSERVARKASCRACQRNSRLHPCGLSSYRKEGPRRSGAKSREERPLKGVHARCGTDGEELNCDESHRHAVPVLPENFERPQQVLRVCAWRRLINPGRPSKAESIIAPSSTANPATRLTSVTSSSCEQLENPAKRRAFSVQDGRDEDEQDTWNLRANRRHRNHVNGRRVGRVRTNRSLPALRAGLCPTSLSTRAKLTGPRSLAASRLRPHGIGL
jgi:hypothetical protein